VSLAAWLLAIELSINAMAPTISAAVHHVVFVITPHPFSRITLSVALLGNRIEAFIQIAENLPLSNKIAGSAIRASPNAIVGEHNFKRSLAHAQSHRSRSTIGKRQI
jgi:hypothetical protein